MACTWIVVFDKVNVYPGNSNLQHWRRVEGEGGETLFSVEVLSSPGKLVRIHAMLEIMVERTADFE